MFRNARYFDKNQGRHNFYGEVENVTPVITQLATLTGRDPDTARSRRDTSAKSNRRDHPKPK